MPHRGGGGAGQIESGAGSLKEKTANFHEVFMKKLGWAKPAGVAALAISIGSGMWFTGCASAPGKLAP